MEQNCGNCHNHDSHHNDHNKHEKHHSVHNNHKAQYYVPPQSCLHAEPSVSSEKDVSKSIVSCTTCNQINREQLLSNNAISKKPFKKTIRSRTHSNRINREGLSNYSVISKKTLNHCDDNIFSGYTSINESIDAELEIGYRESFDIVPTLHNYLLKDQFNKDYLELSNRLKNTTYIVFLCVSCLLGNLAVGYYWFLYNELFFHIKKPFGISEENSSLVEGSINGVFFAGGLIGSIISRFLDNIAHTRIFIIIDIMMLIGIAGSAITNIPTLIASRALIGISAGINFPMNNSYLKQIAPSSLLVVLSNLGPILMLLGGVFDSVIFIPYAVDWFD